MFCPRLSYKWMSQEEAEPQIIYKTKTGDREIILNTNKNENNNGEDFSYRGFYYYW